MNRTIRIAKVLLFLATLVCILSFSNESQAARYMNAEIKVKNKNKIELTWSKKSVSKYEIYRAVCDKEYNPGKYKKIATISGKKTKYVDKKVKYKKRYSYLIKAYKKKGNKIVYKYKAELNGYTGMEYSNWEECLKSDTETSPSSIRLCGYQSGIIPTAYEIYRKNESSTWEQIAIVKGIDKTATFEYIDTNVTKGKTYCYKFRPYKKTGGKKLYGKYSSVMKLTAVYRDPVYTLENLTESNKLTKSIVIALTSNEGNGTTQLDNSAQYIIYSYRKNKKDNMEFIDLVPAKYSLNGVTWNAFPEDGIQLAENQTVYVELEEINGKEFEFYSSGVIESDIEWWMQYNNMKYILDIDFLKATAGARSNGEYYH